MIRMISEKLSVEPSQITKETEFVKDLGADSLDLVELIADFELEFDWMPSPMNRRTNRDGRRRYDR
jgi:acyl carrier protein